MDSTRALLYSIADQLQEIIDEAKRVEHTARGETHTTREGYDEHLRRVRSTHTPYEAIYHKTVNDELLIDEDHPATVLHWPEHAKLNLVIKRVRGYAKEVA